jgi:hypothetical protein
MSGPKPPIADSGGIMIISSQVRIDDDGKSASIVYLTSTEQPLFVDDPRRLGTIRLSGSARAKARPDTASEGVVNGNRLADHVALHESAVGPEPKCRDASQRGFRSGLSVPSSLPCRGFADRVVDDPVPRCARTPLR